MTPALPWMFTGTTHNRGASESPARLGLSLVRAQQTVSNLQELELKVLRHPPYLPNHVPSKFHFVQSLNNFMVENKISTVGL